MRYKNRVVPTSEASVLEAKTIFFSKADTTLYILVGLSPYNPLQVSYTFRFLTEDSELRRDIVQAYHS